MIATDPTVVWPTSEAEAPKARAAAARQFLIVLIVFTLFVDMAADLRTTCRDSNGATDTALLEGWMRIV